MASMKYRTDKRRWQVRWNVTCPDTRIVKGSRFFRDKSLATTFKRHIEGCADKWRSGLAQSGGEIPGIVATWKRYIRRHTDRTQEHYVHVIDAFVASLPADTTDISYMNPSHVNAYVETLQDTGRKNRTCNAHLTVIKSFCRWAARHCNCNNAAGGYSCLAEEPPAPRYLVRVEYEKALAVADGPVRDHLEFLAHTGLRITEFCNLTWATVNHNNTSITIVGKGRRVRTIPLNGIAARIIERQRPPGGETDPTNYIFLSKSKTRLKRNGIYLSFSPLAKKSGIAQFGPHALRHFFGSELLIRGVDIAKVSKLLGHSSIRTTERTYIHILPADLANTTDVLL